MSNDQKDAGSAHSDLWKRPYPELDYTITDPHQRTRIAHQIVNAVPPEKLTPYYIEELAKYITETEKTKKEKTVITNNRKVTIDKRETSFQGFVSKLQSGEDGIYNYIEKDVNALLSPKVSITEQDLQDIPELRELHQSIELVKKQKERSSGRKRRLLTKQLIEMQKDQYLIKAAFKPIAATLHPTKNFNKQIDFSQHVTINECGEPSSDGLVSFFDPHHISCLLCNYSNIKKDMIDAFQSDLYYIIEDFEKLVKQALAETPALMAIVRYKIQDKSNKEIVKAVQRECGILYTPEYISTLWRKKIPKLISDKAKEDWLIWHYTFEEKGHWKKCSRCNEIKLAHPYFFTKNRTSKDGYYSLCKKCRNSKNKKGVQK